MYEDQNNKEYIPLNTMRSIKDSFPEDFNQKLENNY